MSDQESFDELAGAQRVLTFLRRRRQYLLEQAAVEGPKTPFATHAEIEQVSTEISRYETEIARLQTEMAIDRFSVAEAEYRAALATAWHTCPRPLGIMDRTALELKRLQLGIIPERAGELEREVRTTLAEEIFYQIQPELIPNGDWIGRDTVQEIGRVIRLDASTATRLLIHYTRADIRELLIHHKEDLLRKNNVWEDTEDHAMFEQWLADLLQTLEEHKSNLGPPPDRSLVFF